MAHRKGRSVLTGAGIVLGVAILFGVLVANATTQQGVDDMIENWTGRSDVLVGATGVFDANLPRGTVDKVARLPDVVDVVPDFGFGTTLPDHPDRADEDEPTEIWVAGIAKDAPKIQNYNLEAGRLPKEGADELIVSTTLTEDIDVAVGDNLEIKGKAKKGTLEIVGVLTNEGAGRQPGVTYTSMATVHRLAGEPNDVYNGAAVILRDGVNVDRWIDKHRGAIPAIRLRDADSLAAGFKDFLTTFGTFLTFFAGITLFVGAFLIYLTLSMAVIERTRMYGTLRALGTTRGQVFRIVFLEAIVLGVVSTVVGLIVGLGLAKVLLTLIANLFDLDLPGLVITPGAVIGAVIVGMVVTTGSALIPAYRAGRLAPVEAMKGDYVRDTKLSRTWIAGAVILAVCVSARLGGLLPNDTLGSMSVIGILLGGVLLVPLLLRPLASLLGRITNRLARGVGDIAVLHLAKERSRSAYTLALVMVVMAMLFASGGLYLSVRAAADEIIERQFGADIFIEPETPDRAAIEKGLRERKDLATITPLRFGEVAVVDGKKREQFFVRIIEPESYFDVASYFWKDGEDAAAEGALTEGGAVLVSEEVARQINAKRGDVIAIDTTKGDKRFKVEAIYVSPPGPPEMSMGIVDAKRYFSARDPFAYIADVREGEDAAVVAERVEDAFPGALHTETAAQVKEEARTQVGTYFQIVYAILAIAAIVGLLGLANTLAMSILHRFREIGILRAIGVTRSQTWRMVLVESLTMGLAAFVLSMPLGWLLTYLVVSASGEGFGFSMPTIYPWTWIPIVALFGLIIALIAAIAPGRRASKLHVVSALQYE